MHLVWEAICTCQFVYPTPFLLGTQCGGLMCLVWEVNCTCQFAYPTPLFSHPVLCHQVGSIFDEVCKKGLIPLCL